MKKVSILGAGWLGLSLAEELQINGYEVIGTYRSNERKVDLSYMHVPSLYVDLETPSLPQELFMCDVLCIFIPPSKSENYLESMQRLTEHPAFKNIKHIIFTSSTSVYEEVDRKTETSPLDMSKKITQAEMLFQEFPSSCILRLAGLMGEERYLCKYYPQEVPNALTKVNHVHKSDVIAILLRVIERELKGVFNVCAPLHPTREEIITHQCNSLLRDIPQFEQKASKKGVVDTKKMESSLAYMYKYPNPVYFPLIKNQDAFWYNPTIF